MREFKYGVGVIATIFLLNLLLVKLSEKSSTKTDFRGKNQKDMSHDGTKPMTSSLQFLLAHVTPSRHSLLLTLFQTVNGEHQVLFLVNSLFRYRL